MVSAILQNLEDLDSGIDTCLLYLEKLHKLPAVEEMFFVYLHGGLKSILNKKEREENIISITRINYVLYNFKKNFSASNISKLFVAFDYWPTIQLGKGTYNPLSTHQKISTKMDG